MRGVIAHKITILNLRFLFMSFCEDMIKLSCFG